MFVCKCVLGSQEEDTCVSYEEEDTCMLGSPRASQPLNIRLCLSLLCKREGLFMGTQLSNLYTKWHPLLQ